MTAYGREECALDGLWILDLETVPSDAHRGQGVTVPPWWLDRHDFIPPPKKQVPSNIRNPAKIAQRQREIDEAHPGIVAAAEEEHRIEVERLYRRRALGPWTCQVVSVALHPAGQGTADGVWFVLDRSGERDPGEKWLIRRLDAVMREQGVRGLLCWGGFDGPVLRARRAANAPDTPALQAALRVRTNGGRAWLAHCMDPSELTAQRLLGRREGWALKDYARKLGAMPSAGVKSGAVLDAWVAGDAVGVGQRAAEDVALVAEVCEREGLWPEIGRWWAHARRPV